MTDTTYTACAWCGDNVRTGSMWHIDAVVSMHGRDHGWVCADCAQSFCSDCGRLETDDEPLVWTSADVLMCRACERDWHASLCRTCGLIYANTPTMVCCDDPRPAVPEMEAYQQHMEGNVR